MRKIAFYLLSLGLVAVACDSASSKIKDSNSDDSMTAVVDAQGTPVMTFEEEMFDFGTIEEGVVAEHIFKFKNTGDAPLIISSAQGSCGCTVPEYPRTPIAPGAEGEIKVSFNSAGRSGRQDKQVTINANTVPNTVVIKITSEVTPKAQQ